MRNYFTFGEYDSRDFGVYISGEGTYNAPARVYNAVSVPGRNGDLLIDEGKYENITLKYPAFIAGDNFRENLAAFRSAMLSVKGYARLADTYHPDEYRRAYFGDEITVKARNRNDAGQFDIIFTCDPRRFLLSGETAITYPGGASKNLLPYPYDNTTKDTNGIRYVDNGDGTVTFSGQKAGSLYSAFFELQNTNSWPDLTDGEQYTISGCPANTGDNNFFFGMIVNGTGGTFTDRGLGYTFTYHSGSTYRFFISVVDNIQHDATTIKPMIRKASDPGEWEPYVDPNTIVNPTLFASKPVIKVTPADDYNPNNDNVITIGGQQITLHHISPYVMINSEIEDSYCGTSNLNSQVTFGNGKFPVINPGSNTVSKPSTIQSVEITPNWYRL